jgi:hypothetical protein
MKKLVVVFLCFFASNAFASSADSGKCPWPIPFTIKIHAAGFIHSFNSNSTDPREYPNTDFGTEPDTIDFEFTVDTSTSYWKSIGDSNSTLEYSLNADILRFSLAYNDTVFSPISGKISSSITFAPGKDSIISLTYQEKETYYHIASMPEIDRNYAFQISSLLFDDTSIFTTDSSFSVHNISMTDFETDVYIVQLSPPLYDYNDDFTASSVDLSGIFRAATFSNPQSIVTESPQTNNLAIYSSNGSIACSFDVSDHVRNLEIFSPLGIREASYTIQAGQTEASLPHLPAGFYFVRLEGSMAKVYISGS